MRPLTYLLFLARACWSCSSIRCIIICIDSGDDKVSLELECLSLRLGQGGVLGSRLDLLKQELHQGRSELGRAVDEPLIDQEARALLGECLRKIEKIGIQ